MCDKCLEIITKISVPQRPIQVGTVKCSEEEKYEEDNRALYELSRLVECYSEEIQKEMKWRMNKKSIRVYIKLDGYFFNLLLPVTDGEVIDALLSESVYIKKEQCKDGNSVFERLLSIALKKNGRTIPNLNREGDLLFLSRVITKFLGANRFLVDFLKCNMDEYISPFGAIK